MVGAATVQVRPLEAEPWSTESWSAEPWGAEPWEAAPLRAEPLSAEPLRAEPLGVELRSAEPVGVEPVGAEPVGAEPVGAEPAGAEPLGEGLTALLAGEQVRRAHELGSDSGVVSGAGMLPVLPALRGLLPKGALARGSVVSAGPWGLLCLALAAGPVAAGAWCAVAGIPEFGVAAAADAGLDPARLLLVPEPGSGWQQAVASLLDGCDLVVFRPTAGLPAQGRRKLEAAARRHGAVLLVAGDWPGAQVRLRIAAQEWTGIGSGHGRLRGRRAEVVADGRGDWSLARSRWLWLPGPDGTVTAITPGVAGTTGAAEADLPQASSG